MEVVRNCNNLTYMYSDIKLTHFNIIHAFDTRIITIVAMTKVLFIT